MNLVQEEVDGNSGGNFARKTIQREVTVGLGLQFGKNLSNGGLPAKSTTPLRPLGDRVSDCPTVLLQKQQFVLSTSTPDTNARQIESSAVSHGAGAALAEYAGRLDSAKIQFKKLDQRDALVAGLRGLTFFAGLGILIWCYAGDGPSWLLLPPFFIFCVLVRIHDRVIDRVETARRRVTYYEEAIRRVQDDWSDDGVQGERYIDPEHSYSADLDLFGPGSLFQLLSRGRTRLGEDRLAEWLQHPAAPDVVRARQRAVESLRHELNLREDLAVLDAAIHENFDQNFLLKWSTEPAQLIDESQLKIARGLSALAGMGALAGLMGFGVSPFLIMVVILMPFLNKFRAQIMSTLQEVDDVGKGLEILSQVLDLIENRKFDDPWLNDVTERVQFAGEPPSRQIARLAKYIRYMFNSIRNNFFAPIAMILCLPLHLTHAIENWRATVGRHISLWLSAVADFEAAVSLSGFAYEHPENPFPEISEDSVVLNAQQLAHPLLPAAECVRNSISLETGTQMLMVSGSNMSGKSTLLRTIGVNTVLAFSGAPVCADAMTISPMQLATAMRISDSLQQGRSLFFSVLSRLKRVVDLTENETTVLFLLDEILQGTNSHDRRIGAEAVIRSLLEKRAIGLVTTHDLALTEIADSFPSIRNVHFADQISDGTMTFDYQLRPGVVQKSNALELMRLVGLEV